jgi:hypothetical protein
MLEPANGDGGGGIESASSDQPDRLCARAHSSFSGTAALLEKAFHSLVELVQLLRQDRLDDLEVDSEVLVSDQISESHDPLSRESPEQRRVSPR